MPAESVVGLPVIFGFLMVLARVTGVILFVPIPGMQSVPDAARIVLALVLSIILMPVRPPSVPATGWLWQLPAWLAGEFAFGLLIGVCVSFVLEGFQMAAQMAGFQAGYSLASTIDPNTQADSAILQIITQMLASLLFLACGYDRAVIRILAGSFERIPTAGSLGGISAMEAVIRLGSQIFVLGCSLAMPVLALLILVDLSFAIVGKVHAQFQLMPLLFTTKMVLGIGMFAASLAAFSKAGQLAANHTLQGLLRLVQN